MRVARPGESLEHRQEVVVDLLNFIRDFYGLDTTVLVAKTFDDQKFLEAAEAVLESAVGPWKSVDALRDFAVQALYGERPADKSLSERARPGRVSPFSVPFQLLRALAPSGQFDPRQLRTFSIADALESNGYAGEEVRWETRVTPGEAWLVTTMWARTVPTKLRHTKIMVTDFASNRILHEANLWAMLEDPTPCCWWLSSYASLEMRITRQREEEPTTILLALEGWRYPVRH